MENKSAEEVLGSVVGQSLINRDKEENETGLKLSGMFNSSKLARYHKAVKDKSILMGDPDEDGIDYSHMDFVLAGGKSIGFFEGMSNLQAIQLFWKAHFPYHSKLVGQYEFLYNHFRTLLDDQEEVLSGDADTKFELKWLLHFVKENGLEHKADTFLRKRKQEAMVDTEKIVRASESLPKNIIQ